MTFDASPSKTDGRALTPDEFLAAREPVDGPIPYPRDWLVTRVIDFGPTQFYRYLTIGENMNQSQDGVDRLFSWRVPTLSWRYFVDGEE